MSPAPPAPSRSVRPRAHNQRPCRGRCGCAMASRGSGRLLAPLEDVLAEGEVMIEGESGNDIADLKHAANP